MKNNYLIRLDDACPTMNHDKWVEIENVLDEFNIKPLVGVIPANNDVKLKIDNYDISFWNKVKAWQSKGWEVALHGYDHVYTSKEAGIIPFWHKSEFAGVTLSVQKEKIKRGLNIFRDNDIIANYFFAPSHTFDDNTLLALQESSHIKIISDGIALKPYTYKGFCFIPQIIGHCVKIPIPGIYTFCFHPNIMTKADLDKLKQFLINNKEKFIRWNEIDLSQVKERSIIDKLLHKLFFIVRKFRRLI